MFGKKQRRVVGVMSGLQKHNYKERLKKLGMTTLAERRHYVDMHIVYKMMKNANSLDHTTWFERTEELRNHSGPF
jgi:hypothetical protein